MVSGFWKGRSVLVTGASGLIGPWLVEELLRQGAEPACLVRDIVPGSRFFSDGLSSKVAIVRGELEDRNSIERAINEYEPEAIFHLGAQAIVQAARETGRIVTVDNHNIYGGLGSAVAEVVAEEAPARLKRIGVRDLFGKSGTNEQMMKRFGLRAEDIERDVLEFLKR